MKNLSKFIVIFALTAGLWAAAEEKKDQSPGAHGEPVKRMLIEMRTGADKTMQGWAADLQATVHHRIDHLLKDPQTGEAHTLLALSLPQASVAKLARDPRVIRMEEDVKRVPLAQRIPYGIDKVGARDLWDQDRDGQIDAGAPTGAGITVGIIDSGISAAHEDLADLNIIGGYPADWNEDLCGHGTHVAGTIAAADNATGVVGVSPGEVSLFIVKVFGDDCSWTYASNLIDAAQRCADNGAQIISMSLGGSWPSSIERAAFQSLYDQGLLIIAAAGNDGDTSYSFPASYDAVISVAATDAQDEIANFSQRNEQVELAAPGVAILSTTPFASIQEINVGGRTFDGRHIAGGLFGVATAELVFGGLADQPGDWAGKVVLCERGAISFREKVDNITAGGGIAAVIFNHSSGNFNGTLGDGINAGIPAISLSQEDGQTILNQYLGLTARVESGDKQYMDGYESWNGTSMATPHVSGVAALLWSANPAGWTNGQIREALTQTAVDLGDPGRDHLFGYGRIDAPAALEYLQVGPPVLSAPIASASVSGNLFDYHFDGSASADADGQIISWWWDFGDGSGAEGAIQDHTYTQAGVYTATLLVTDNDGLTDSAAFTLTIEEPISLLPLENGVPVTGLSGLRTDELHFLLELPAGVANLRVTTSGGSGDADLYLKQGGMPSSTDYDLRGFTYGNDESVQLQTPAAGTYYVMVRGFFEFQDLTLLAEWNNQVNQAPTAAFSLSQNGLQVSCDASASSDIDGQITTYRWNFGDGITASGITASHTYLAAGSYTVSLTVTDNNGAGNTISHLITVSEPVDGVTELATGIPVSNLENSGNTSLEFMISVEPDTAFLFIQLSGGTGDADLYAKFGAPSGNYNYDYRSIGMNNEEFISVTAPRAGDWYITVKGYADFSGVTLVAHAVPQQDLISFNGSVAGRATSRHSLSFGGGTLMLQLDWDNDQDLDIRVYDAYGTRIGLAATVSKPERLELNLAPGEYTLEIYNYDYGDNANYSLTAILL